MESDVLANLGKSTLRRYHAIVSPLFLSPLHKVITMRKLFLAGALASAMASPLLAQPGKLIKNVPLPVKGFGVSVAVDCNGIVYYTLWRQARVFKTDKNGRNLGFVNTGNVQLDELAYDAKRNVLWGCQHGSNPVRIYRVNPATGAATFAFTASRTRSVGTFRDGLAYDASTDSLYVSGDVSNTIEEYKVTGTYVRTLTPKNSRGGTLGAISGVSVGRGDLLYLGQNGRRQIVQVRKSSGAFVKVFASPGGARDEGLECDPINFAPKLALWSREFNQPGFLSVIELEAGTCSCGGRQNDPPRFVSPTPRCGSTIPVTPRRLVRITIRVTDPQPTQRITLSVAGAPPGASFSPGLPITGAPGAAVQTVMTWTPTGNGRWTTTFTAKDDDPRSPLSSTCRFTFDSCVDASWANYGTGWPGTRGVPIFTLTAPPVLGRTTMLNLGNSSPAATHACVLFGTATANIKTAFDGTQLVLPSATIGFGIPVGTVRLPLLMPSSSTFCGRTFYMQAIELDKGASKSISFSRGLRLTLGRSSPVN